MAMRSAREGRGALWGGRRTGLGQAIPRANGLGFKGQAPGVSGVPWGCHATSWPLPSSAGDPGSGHGTPFSLGETSLLSPKRPAALLSGPYFRRRQNRPWEIGVRRERLPARRHSPRSSVGIQSILGNLLPRKIPTRKQRSSATLSRALKQSLCGTWLLFGFAIH